MTGRRQTSWLLTNIATAVNSNYCQPVNIQGREKKSYREGIFIKDFPRRDPIIPEDIQKISAIISSSAFSSNIGDFVQSTSTHMNSSFLSTQTRAWKKRNLNSSLSLQRVASPADILRRASHIPSWGRNAWCTPKNSAGEAIQRAALTFCLPDLYMELATLSIVDFARIYSIYM